MSLYLTAGGVAGGAGTMIIMVVALIALMYFMMIRPQSKERKKMENLKSSMEVGDSVLTNGGFYGVIIAINENDIVVEFGGNRNCRIPMKKEAIMQLEKPGAAEAALAKKKEEEAKKAAEKAAKEAAKAAKKNK